MCAYGSVVGKSLYFNQLKLDHGISETKYDIFCFVLLCLTLMLVVVWQQYGVYVCDACEHMPVCAYVYTNEGRRRESSVFLSCPLPYCLESCLSPKQQHSNLVTLAGHCAILICLYLPSDARVITYAAMLGFLYRCERFELTYSRLHSKHSQSLSHLPRPGTFCL